MTDAFSMNRRALMGNVAMLIGASALPADLFAAPVRKGRRFLPAPRYQLLAAVADTMVPVTDTPGALAVGVPAQLDALLRDWASPKTREEIINALTAIDADAIKNAGAGFGALSPEKRKAVLVAHDQTALKNVPRKDKLTGLAALMGAPSVADPGYSKLKDLVVSLYYVSQVALTQELIYEHVPGTWVPSLKITPETRPFAGTGPF